MGICACGNPLLALIKPSKDITGFGLDCTMAILLVEALPDIHPYEAVGPFVSLAGLFKD